MTTDPVESAEVKESHVHQSVSHVRQFVKDRIRANEEADLSEEFRDYGRVQVNIRLHAFDAFLLDELAKHLRASRSELALELMTKAIADAWDAAGLPDPFSTDELTAKARAYIEAHTK